MFLSLTYGFLKNCHNISAYIIHLVTAYFHLFPSDRFLQFTLKLEFTFNYMILSGKENLFAMSGVQSIE